MSLATATRTVPDDWYDGVIPPNVSLDDSAYLGTTYSFLFYRSELPEGVSIGRGSMVCPGSMFDVGPRGRIRIGDYAVVTAAWFLCDCEIEIGDYALISWNVLFMDSYRVSTDPVRRRCALQLGRGPQPCRLSDGPAPKPIRLGSNVWIGFDCCILPGVTIGRNSIVGARSVVVDDIPANTMAAGNPARPIKRIDNDGV